MTKTIELCAICGKEIYDIMMAEGNGMFSHAQCHRSRN
jgi:hypothetical protein